MSFAVAVRALEVQYSIPKYRATPTCLLFDGRCSHTHLVPVPVGCDGTLPIMPGDLNIPHWLFTKPEIERGEPLKQELRAFASGPLATSAAMFLAYFTPQQVPFRPGNRCIRLLSGQALQGWYGNIVVSKVNDTGHVINVDEKDIGLIEHLVLRAISDGKLRNTSAPV